MCDLHDDRCDSICLGMTLHEHRRALGWPDGFDEFYQNLFASRTSGLRAVYALTYMLIVVGVVVAVMSRLVFPPLHHPWPSLMAMVAFVAHVLSVGMLKAEAKKIENGSVEFAFLKEPTWKSSEK